MQSAIVISPRSGQRWLWAAADQPAGSGTLAELAAWYAGQDPNSSLVLLVPGEDVLLARVNMPTRNPSRILRALPFALEEHVLEDPAGLHCVPGNWLDRDTLSCAAISRDRLKALIDALASEGMAPDKACPDTLCIPWRENTIQVVTANGRALVRWGKCSAAASDDSASELLLKGLQAGPELATVPVERYETADEMNLLSACARQIGQLPLDLLQGEFLPAQSRAGWRSWRLPAVLAAAVLLLAVTLEGLQVRELNRDSNRLSTAISEQFRTIFPHVERVQSDPGPQVQIELRRLRQQAGAGEDLFLELLARAAPALAAATEMNLERLQYRDGQLELGLAAGQIADLDALRVRLQAAGINANQGAAQLDNDRVSGTITISSARPGTGP